MKLLFLNFILAAFFALSNTSSNPISPDGYYKGIKLCGDVMFVESGEDFRVRVVDSYPDLKVRIVDRPASEIGEWRVVKSHADFKVRIVKSFADFDIRYVTSFPGVER